MASNGDALRYAAPELLADIAFVLTAVSQDGTALFYASADLQNNKDVALAAVEQNPDALFFASANKLVKAAWQHSLGGDGGACDGGDGGACATAHSAHAQARALRGVRGACREMRV